LAKDPNCIFCKIVAGEIPAKLVKEGENFLAFSDINAQAPHHMLVIPKEHYPNITEFRDAKGLGELFLAAADLAKEKGLKEGFRLVVNTGADGGQTVFHLHIHILGGRAMTWPPG
jgi:histidine triad (HIT) family protein